MRQVSGAHLRSVAFLCAQSETTLPAKRPLVITSGHAANNGLIYFIIILKFHKFVIHKFVKLYSFCYLCPQIQ